jgi:N-acetylmuramoyl-L-alanine amidase
MPAILIEGGFMDHSEDLKRIMSDRERAKMADAIVDGVRAFKRLAERN